MNLRHAAAVLVGSALIAVGAAAPSSSSPSIPSRSADTSALFPNSGLAQFTAAFTRSQAAPEKIGRAHV